MTEHEIYHRAELYIYLNLLAIKTSPIFGLTAEEVIENSLKIRKNTEGVNLFIIHH